MNLRPKLAADFAEAIAYNIEHRASVRGDLSQFREFTLATWQALILERFESHSVPNVGEFLEKYPQVQQLIDLVQAEARERFEGVQFELELAHEHDSCHTCREGQYLKLHIQTKLPFDSPTTGEYDETSPFWKADDAFMEWRCADDSPYRKLAKELGEVEDLLHVDLTTDL